MSAEQSRDGWRFKEWRIPIDKRTLLAAVLNAAMALVVSLLTARSTVAAQPAFRAVAHSGDDKVDYHQSGGDAVTQVTWAQNSGPSVPALSRPANGSSMAQGTDVTLLWNWAANASQYKVELWGWPYGLMTPCGWQSGTSCRVGQLWPTTLYWRVKARNSSGQESNWSATWSFTIQEASPPTPSVPGLISPAHGSSMVKTTDVTLLWTWAPNASQYKVELWGWPYGLMAPCGWQSGTSCRVGQLWPGTMYWRVKARNSSGQEGSWSGTWSFTIQEASPPTPSVPALISPANGASMAQSTDVTLIWSWAANASQYRVEMWGGPYGLMAPCGWQSGTSCRVGQLWPGTVYWRVKARNSSGQESNWSGTWSFTIQQASPPSPSMPALVSPANGASMAQSTDVTLIWSWAANTTQYKVELWGGPYGLMAPCGWQTGTSCRVGQLWPGTVYWHVKARNSSGQESSWSGTWSFTIQQASPPSPSVPVLLSPVSGLAVPQGTDITLIWNWAANASQYRVELWGGPSGVMAPCGWQSEIWCRVGKLWPGTVHWHVKARNSSGHESSWSGTWSFTIQ